MDQPGLFLLLLVFVNNIVQNKNISVGEIQTWILGVEGEHADHLTTTMA